QRAARKRRIFAARIYGARFDGSEAGRIEATLLRGLFAMAHRSLGKQRLSVRHDGSHVGRVACLRLGPIKRRFKSNCRWHRNSFNGRCHRTWCVMGAVIKSGNAAALRLVQPLAAMPPPSLHERERGEFCAQIAALQAEIRRLAATVESSRTK